MPLTRSGSEGKGDRVCLGRLKAMVAWAILANGLGFLQAKPPLSHKARLELKGGWYYIDGHKALINALGYESGARPGEVPYETAARDLGEVRRDLQRIKAAGFNGIRTWSEMTEAELKVVQSSGLKVVFGIWLKPDAATPRTSCRSRRRRCRPL